MVRLNAFELPPNTELAADEWHAGDLLDVYAGAEVGMSR